MLELLVKYARDHNLEAEPGFKPKDVRWAIVCDADGNFLEVVELGNPAQKRNPGQTFPKCPDLSQPELVAGGETRSHFLVDTAEVVALCGKNADHPRVRAKHAYFLRLLRDADKVMPELGLTAGSLSSEATLGKIRESLENRRAKPDDKVTFRAGSIYTVESDAWHGWWRAFRKGLIISRPETKRTRADKASLPLMRCLVTGDLIQPAATHRKIERLADVGGLPTGDVLIGFDKDSFRSYGLEQAANAAVSEESMCAYRAALNNLIKEHGQRLAGAKVIHWFKGRVAREDDPLAWLEEGAGQQEVNAQKRAEDLLNSIRSGKRNELLDNYFYALTVSGAAGRVIVRDWMEGQFPELVRSIASWFEDLAIVDFMGSKLVPTPGIERVITSLLPPRKRGQTYGDWIKPIGAGRIGLWHAASQGGRISPEALSHLVLLDKKFHLLGTLEGALYGKGKQHLAAIISLLHTRMGLMKAYHVRKNRTKGGVMPSELKPYLNEGHPQPAYQCGRLMALLAVVQRRALGDVGAGVVQRYYAAASATPALVLGRLTRTSQFHLNKLDAGLAHWYEDKIAAIWGRLKDGVPRTLSVEEQSLFALGYYQQMADLITKRSEKSNHEKNKEANHE